MARVIAYLAQGKVRIKEDDQLPRTYESPYAKGVFDRSIKSQQRHAWKGDGDGFISGPMLWGKSGASAGPAPVVATSLCAGPANGQILYSLASGSLCALCTAENLGAEERRLWNDNKRRIQHLNASPADDAIAVSVQHQNSTANIGVMLKDEPGFSEVTEGDSVDTAPRWVPGRDRTIVYQSAGVGRNRDGHALALGPFSVHTVNIDTAEMETLVESSGSDHLSPQITSDGALYFIRRPYNEHLKARPLRALKDTILLPFRLLYALLQFLNFFSMRYTGKKLSTPQGTPRRDVDLQQMMIWGNLVAAQQEGADEDVDLVPSSWQLIRRSPSGIEEVVAKGVLAYDVGPDGSIVYSNGNAIFVRHPDGKKEHLLTERMIEQVVVLRS